MSYNQKIAVLTARLLLGFIFLMQGFGKVFKFGVSSVYENFFKEAYADILPSTVTLFTAYYTSFVELIAGFLLVIGLKRDLALYFLASVLIIVTFGHGLKEPIWELNQVMWRAVLLIFLLIVPKEWDVFSIDQKILNKK